MRPRVSSHLVIRTHGTRPVQPRDGEHPMSRGQRLESGSERDRRLSPIASQSQHNLHIISR